jgi:dTDP-4-dehydrorhamnose 3,5-epimerase
MQFDATPIAGCFVARQQRIVDARGYFARSWCRDELAAHGMNPDMLQLNVGFSHRRGTVRGIHYQREPHAEAKFVRCTRGAIFDVAVDLRGDSPTRGHWFGLELTAEDGTMLFVPAGCAHGYQTLADDTEMYYMTTARYAPGAARGVPFDDPALAIAWPAPVTLVSDQDRQWPRFDPRSAELA